MPNFKSRLLKAKEGGDLTVADLAGWFDAPFATCRYWVYDADPDIIPRGPRGRVIFRRLKMLEWAIRHEIGFPVPAMLRQRDRPRHIRDTRDAIHARVSADYFTE